MNEFSRIFRLWGLITAAFIFLAAGLVAIFFAYRIYLFEQDGEEIQKRLIEAQLKGQYGKIVEEVYLHLDATDARRAILQDLIGTKGKLSLQVLYQTPAKISQPKQLLGQWRRETGIKGDTYLLPLVFGDLYVADLVTTIRWAGLLSMTEIRGILIGIGGVVSLLYMAWFFTFIVLKKQIIGPLITEVINLQQIAAVAKTTQMLAHDVRKPFSMLKTGLNLLQASSKDPKKSQVNLNFLISEVDRATKSVDGMLTDIMEVGSTSTELIQEPAAPEILIEMTLGEAFRIYPKSKISIFYDFKHSAMLNVHLKKVSRVFSNIVGNAIQAMNYSGKIWFRTRMDRNFVQFCIGNSGSSIPPEHLGKLFEAFFTSGKKSGTGLGLAIAQKVVHAHGGKIWCESSKTPEHPEGMVEFFFTLPIAPGAELVTTANLPHHSDEITKMTAMMGNSLTRKSEGEINRNESIIHQELIQRVRALSRPLGILIIDDESIYRSALAGWIEESPELAQVCRIHLASGSHDAINNLQSNNIDLIITDIDMGANALCGFDLVKELRTTHGYRGLIFVHSNRIVPDDHRKASDFGANGFLPKPMAKGQLFKLILQSIQSISVLTINISPGHIKKPETLDASESNSSPLNKWNSPRHLIAVIDDEYFFRHQWPPFLKGFDTVCYSNAEEFLNDWDQISKKLVAVVTDQYLGSGMSGIQLGSLLRKKSLNLTLILSTSDLSLKKYGHIFDAVVDKDAREEAPKIIQHIIEKKGKLSYRTCDDDSEKISNNHY